MMSDSRFEFVKIDVQASEHIAAPAYSYWRSVSRAFFAKKQRFFINCGDCFSLIALIQPILSGYDPQIVPNINDASMRF